MRAPHTPPTTMAIKASTRAATDGSAEGGGSRGSTGKGGSRYIPGGSIPHWSWHRRALSRWGNRYAAFMLSLDVTDATSGFRAYRSGMVERIDIDSVRADGYGFQIEMAHRVARGGGRIVEVPIEFVDRREGTSKMSSWIVIEALGLVT